MREIYNSAPVGMAQLDRNLRYIRVNDLLAAMNGKPVSEHIGKTVSEVFPELAIGVESVCRQVLETGRAVCGIKVTSTMMGGQLANRHWVCDYYPLRASNNDVVGVSVFVRDADRLPPDATSRLH